MIRRFAFSLAAAAVLASAVLAVPSTAHAQDSSPPDVATVLPPVVAPAPQGTLESILGTLLVVALPFVVKLFRDWQKDNAERRLSIVDHAAQLAFWATEEAKRMGVNVPSAVLYAEGKFHEVLNAQGVNAKPGELVRARATWSAIHGQDKAAAGASAEAGKAAAATLAAGTASSVP